MDEDEARNYSKKPDPYKSMRPDRLQLRVLRALANALARWRSPTTGRKQMLHPIFTDAKTTIQGIAGSAILTSVPGKIME